MLCQFDELLEDEIHLIRVFDHICIHTCAEIVKSSICEDDFANVFDIEIWRCADNVFDGRLHQ